MCASTKEFDSGSPIVEALVRSLEGLAFGDLPLAQARVCIYGPVCIAAAYRHRGLLQRLFTALKARLAGRFDDVIYRFDTSNGAVEQIKVGAEPHGLTVWPQPGRYSLGHTGNLR